MPQWCTMVGMPEEIQDLLRGAAVRDSSSSPEARVALIDRDGGYYLKTAAAGSLAREAEMDQFFYRKGLGPKVAGYWSGERDWLLTERLPGSSGIDPRWLAEPQRLSALMGEWLRALHETDPAGCPVMDRTADYLCSAAAGYHAGKFDPSHWISRRPLTSADEAWKIVCEAAPLLKTDVLLHGDYCLPNLMLQNWRLAGFIDVGMGGVGDRHIDLFWGVWTLAFNLKTGRWGARLLDAYGRDKVDPDRLQAIEAAEVFG